MTFDSPITDVDFLYLIDPLDGGEWGIYECEVMFDSGYTARGRIQGDGKRNWDSDSFEEDELV